MRQMTCSLQDMYRHIEGQIESMLDGDHRVIPREDGMNRDLEFREPRQNRELLTATGMKVFHNRPELPTMSGKLFTDCRSRLWRQIFPKKLAGVINVSGEHRHNEII